MEVTLPDLQTIGALSGTILLAEAAAIHDQWTREIPDQYAEAVVWRLQQGRHIPATRYLQALRLRPRITESFVSEVFATVDAVFTPTITMPVPDFSSAQAFTSAEAPSAIFETTKCTVWANYLGLPAISIPCGFTDGNLPVGCQLTARPFDESTLLALGRAYQACTGWHMKRPPTPTRRRREPRADRYDVGRGIPSAAQAQSVVRGARRRVPGARRTGSAAAQLLHLDRVWEAVAAAERADAAIARGDWRGPLHGIPLAHKDMFYRAGRVGTFGSKILRDYAPDYTSTVMTRLAETGAVYLGSLNMAEFATGPVGQNDHFGQTRNPWHTDHISGGSSSGSGAALAARACFGSLGSDTGGSCRLPAGMCGVVGLKPTYGLVSRHGGLARCWSLDCFGPLARTARDVAMILQVIAGHDENDPTTTRDGVPDYLAGLEGDLDGLRVGVPGNHLYPDVDLELKPMLEAALSALEDLGCELVELEMPDPDGSTRSPTLSTSPKPQHCTTSGSARARRTTRSRSAPVWRRDTFLPATRYIQAQRLRPRVLSAFDEAVFARADVLFTPVTSIPVPRIEDAGISRSADAPRIVDAITRCTRWVSYLGLPALSVPCGFTERDFPVGFQVVGRPFDESLLLKIANSYQSGTDWHTRTPPL